MKIAILYIGIGDYKVFWSDFYSSCEKYFLSNIEKTYYFFTDVLDKKLPPNVIQYKQEDLGWPGNTLYRFQMFLRIKEDLIKYDYIYFFNGNTLFTDEITVEEFVPKTSNDGLLALSWDCYKSYKKNKLPYERRIISTACITKDAGQYYYQGGINGGIASSYLSMIEQCNNMISEDKKNNIIAIHNDESYINKYLLYKKPLIVSDRYGCPQEWKHSSYSKIIFRSKHLFFGTEIDKKKGANIFIRIYKHMKYIISR